MPFDTPSSTSERPHVVIVGAGFAGLEAAKTLRDAPVRVTLVDRNNYHKFQPLLYEVAMAGLEPDDIAHNIRNIFRGNETVNFRLGTVVDIDPVLQRVHLHGNESLAYDHLVLAAGAVSTDFGIPGVEEHAYPLKNVPDAVNLRNRVLRQFERYDRHRAATGEGALTFVVVGGGPTGVEMAGAFVELFDTLNNDFSEFDTREQARCLLLEMEDELLPPYKSPQRAYTRQVLEARGVNVQTNTAVERVASDEVHLADGRTIPTQTLVWAAGVKASPVANLLDAEQDRGDRIIVNPDLTVPEHPEVYAVGDMAAIEGTDGYEPQLAQVAIQSGEHAAEQIQRRLREGTSEEFEYWDLGQMATIGRNAAVAEFAGGIAVRGFLAWFLWVVIHIAKLVGFRNRLSALVNWAYNYFTYNRSARLILDMVPISDDVPMEVEDVDQQVKERLKTVETQPH
ncbi:NAD(P)/FAD-dependent oxidoreductase [Salinibacter altiplanensis]|uniref:NAD(P)/FAD-dependent oxidoreductase n=1 Tax=Salinibacter altiplanensis TaxID=1803181 RepID=UPI000C9F9F06|nr:NAD(P)/FAD-dependent oxidoreductase [Salinibacter altiplanensis]